MSSFISFQQENFRDWEAENEWGQNQDTVTFWPALSRGFRSADSKGLVTLGNDNQKVATTAHLNKGVVKWRY